MTLKLSLFCSAAAITALLAAPTTATAQERQIKITGFGAMSGVVRSFGINSKAAMEAAADQINKAGGVTLGDGTKGKIILDYLDDRCNAEEGISVVRRIAGTDAVVGIGPTCSNVAEPLFGILQKKAGDAGDSGLQFPVFTDVAIKVGLAKISEWAFRNVPNETAMYTELFKWIKATRPDLKTVFGGVEEDFAHSRATWYSVMKDVAAKEGFTIAGEAKWLLADTNFSNQAREAKKANRRHRRHFGASVHHVRHAEGDGPPGRKAETADRTHLDVEPRDDAGLRRGSRHHHHTHQLRAGDARGGEGVRSSGEVQGQPRPPLGRDLGGHVHPQGRDREPEGDGEARYDRCRPRQDPRRSRQADRDGRPARQSKRTSSARRSSRSCSSTPRAASGKCCTSRARDVGDSPSPHTALVRREGQGEGRPFARCFLPPSRRVEDTLSA